jgi:hypothetical protein
VVTGQEVGKGNPVGISPMANPNALQHSVASLEKKRNAKNDQSVFWLRRQLIYLSWCIANRPSNCIGN